MASGGGFKLQLLLAVVAVTAGGRKLAEGLLKAMRVGRMTKAIRWAKPEEATDVNVAGGVASWTGAERLNGCGGVAASAESELTGWPCSSVLACQSSSPELGQRCSGPALQVCWFSMIVVSEVPSLGRGVGATREPG